MTTIPTPRTDAELARVLTDFDLTNIDRREAMADFARLLEVEGVRLGEHFDRELRRVVESRDLDRDGAQEQCAALILAALNGREFKAASPKLQAALEVVAALVNECAQKLRAQPPPDALGAADEKARQAWEDGEGAEVATTAGIWHAAIAYERKRAAGAASQ